MSSMDRVPLLHDAVAVQHIRMTVRLVAGDGLLPCGHDELWGNVGRCRTACLVSGYGTDQGREGHVVEQTIGGALPGV